MHLKRRLWVLGNGHAWCMGKHYTDMFPVLKIMNLKYGKASLIVYILQGNKFLFVCVYLLYRTCMLNLWQVDYIMETCRELRKRYLRTRREWSFILCRDIMDDEAFYFSTIKLLGCERPIVWVFCPFLNGGGWNKGALAISIHAWDPCLHKNV